MACARCSSDRHKKLGVEMNIHFPGREGVDKPTVMLFTDVTVCLDCGFAEFFVPKAELSRLAEDTEGDFRLGLKSS